MTVQLMALSPLKSLEHDLDSAMADQHLTDSGSSPGSSSDYAVHCPGSASETSIWEEWTQATNSTVGDEVSTSNFLPDLTPSNSTSSRLSFQQSDMLSTWISGFHPLTPAADQIDHQPTFMHDLDHPDTTDALPLVYESKTTGISRQLLRALGPLSPSSPLAIQNGLINPLGDPWDGQWSTTRSSFFPDHSAAAVEHLEDITTASKPRHTDIFIGPNGTFESATPGGWTPQILFDRHGSEPVGPTPLKLMASLREAAEVTSCARPREMGLLVDLRSGQDDASVATTSSSAVPMAGILANCKSGPQLADIGPTMTTTWLGKHRLELVELVDGAADLSLLKRPKTATSVEETKLLQSWSDQTYCPASGVGNLASQAMDIIAIGPALNTNGKPRARRGSATDPQSVYARHRREKINERLKNLQNLVPNGAKVDIVTMLDEAIHYVKFLQNQVELLKSDDYWMYATPNNYNGMDLSELQCNVHSQELESSA